jgi:hypothetical protein
MDKHFDTSLLSMMLHGAIDLSQSLVALKLSERLRKISVLSVIALITSDPPSS